jgi:hypothetical protein
MFFDQLMWLWDYRQARSEGYCFRTALRAHPTDLLLALQRTIDSKHVG